MSALVNRVRFITSRTYDGHFVESLLSVLTFALIFRLFHLDARSLWLDEYTSFSVANGSLHDLFSGKDFNWHTPPFYYLLLHFWLLIVPSTEFGLRLFSAILDAANSGLLMLVVGQLFSSRVGFIAGLLYAASPFTVYYAQEARMYPLLVFLTLLLFLLAAAAHQGRFRIGRTLSLAVVGALGMYTHYYFSFVLGFVTLALLPDLNRSPEIRRRWVIGCCVIAVSFLPWVVVVRGLVESGGQAFRKFSFLVLPYAFFRFVAGYGNMPLNVGTKEVWTETVQTHIPILLAFGIFFGAALWIGVRRLVREFPRERVLVLVPLLGVPLVALLISLRVPMLSERYLIAIYPFFVILLALFVDYATRAGRDRRIWGLGLVCSGLVGFSLARYYVSPDVGFEQWRDVARKIESGGPTSLVVVNPDYAKGVLSYYLKSPHVLLGLKPDVTQVSIFMKELYRHETPLSGGFWLVERGGSPPLKETFVALGLQVMDESLFPLENGLRVIRFRSGESDNHA